MKKLMSTNPENYTALIARLALGITIFPHGAQKLMGWFGGNGFTASMQYFTETVKIPYFLGLLVILIEFFGALMLIAGAFTRVAAFAIIIQFIGVITTLKGSGFFMNWAKVGGRPEGFEYFILLFALGFISLIAGGGKASVDAAFNRNKFNLNQ